MLKSRDNPSNVIYWTIRVEQIVRRLRRDFSDSPFDHLKSLFNDYMTSRKSDAIFSAIVRAERYEKYMKTYQHEILQLSGAGDEWKLLEKVQKSVLDILRSLQNLGLYTTFEGEDLKAMYDKKEFLYQSLLA